MLTPMNRWIWIGMLSMGLIGGLMAWGRGTPAPAPAARIGPQDVLHPNPQAPAAAAANRRQAVSELLSEPTTGSADPECQQAHDLLRAGPDSQG